ncbi:MAG TPA: bifunctional oligoribonuclease/PAP phosphatase NrnA [Ignavibacteriales bacterium]|nr:bifunctional oligoribonuclease/PAP phosphatase NrnA [Ignavibacteriales bacterium]HOL80865.1 bifunctional oligoribonuclease/PAP phosphatase NrnA [Ignavibacteriales bacterium]HOM65891.1 bifunctional oligoribonuclease/PAP phosphatase NrnA [Ignavibacteriales bacterium]HPD67647.1 bifunctional oligoribonuclease/PAP phosphatase NrnA [Ignavibacteriales bacterium]HPP33300.1 bifunctional oligoribonuclease/PAP phosphatase NrnA [Ignavibacteriales bacterium]
MEEFKKLVDIINNNQKFVITTHVNPDPDAICSCLIFYTILKNLNKDVKIINTSATPYFIEFLDYEKVIEKYNRDIHLEYINDFDVIVCLDFNHIGRLDTMEKDVIASKAYKICIDHHTEPEVQYFDYLFNNEDYAATVEIMYDLIKATKIIQFDKKIAEWIYIGLKSDTGSFSYERTTAKTYNIAAELVSLGVNPFEIHHLLNSKNRLNKIHLQGHVLSQMKLDDTNKIAYIVVTKAILDKTGAEESEIDGLVNNCLSIEGVEVGLLFIEMEQGMKINFRSKGKVPVNKLAAIYKGGGHHNASGARLFDKELNDEIITDVIKNAQLFIKEYAG